MAGRRSARPMARAGARFRRRGRARRHGSPSERLYQPIKEVGLQVNRGPTSVVRVWQGGWHDVNPRHSEARGRVAGDGVARAQRPDASLLVGGPARPHLADRARDELPAQRGRAQPQDGRLGRARRARPHRRHRDACEPAPARPVLQRGPARHRVRDARAAPAHPARLVPLGPLGTPAHGRGRHRARARGGHRLRRSARRRAHCHRQVRRAHPRAPARRVRRKRHGRGPQLHWLRHRRGHLRRREDRARRRGAPHWPGASRDRLRGGLPQRVALPRLPADSRGARPRRDGCQRGGVRAHRGGRLRGDGRAHETR